MRTRKQLYPYGSIPRLLLFWIVTEATQKKNRRIQLGNSLDAFMREIGLNPRTGGGKRGDAKRLHDQMERLFRSTITFEDRREWGKSYVDMQVAPRGQFWWDPSRAHQDNLWESWVELGEDFFAAITAAPRPGRYASPARPEAVAPCPGPLRIDDPHSLRSEPEGDLPVDSMAPTRRRLCV